MTIANNKATGVKICYIGGGSRGWAWNFMSDLAVQEAISGTVALYDIDKEAAEINMKIGNRISAMPETKSKWNYEAVHEISKAITGADFIIISILPGDFKEMASDVHTPEKYGIYQSVGDTAGPGGLFRALRTIPMYVEIAENIKKHAPDAWVINYTNPMALSIATLYEIFPEIKAFGCCHEVFGTQRLFAKVAEEIHGFENVKREDIKINVLGINHFTWINQASYNGVDLLASYDNYIAKHDVTSRKLTEQNFDSFFVDHNFVKFDLYKRFGIAAAAGDRHLSEFVSWYLTDKDSCKKWGFALTPVEWRIKNREELIKKSRLYATGEIPIDINPSGEEGVLQITALLGLGDFISNVNMPNKGQMSGIDEDVIVETNAVFSKNKAQPIIAGKLPDAVNILTLRHTNVQQLVLKAGLKGDKDLAFWALTQDPLCSKLSLDEARTLFNEMYENTKSYLPF